MLGYEARGCRKIKRHLVRTESFAHLRPQLLRVVADLKAPERRTFPAPAEVTQAQKTS